MFVCVCVCVCVWLNPYASVLPCIVLTCMYAVLCTTGARCFKGNSRVHHLTAEGKHIHSWGTDAAFV